MLDIAYYNGACGRSADIRIPLSDRSLFFGDAVYDAAIGEAGRIFLCEEHLARLYENASRIHLTPPMPPQELRALLDRLAAETEGTPFFLYIQLSRDAPQRVHAYPHDAGTNLLITLTELVPPTGRERLSLITAPDLRYYYCDIKTVNLLPAVLAAHRAEQAHAKETVWVRDGQVTECSHSNISILHGGTLYTHPTDRLILPGITRRHLIQAAQTLGMVVRERPFTVREMETADEILITSSSRLVATASHLNGTPVGGGDPVGAARLSRLLLSEYRAAVSP